MTKIIHISTPYGPRADWIKNYFTEDTNMAEIVNRIDLFEVLKLVKDKTFNLFLVHFLFMNKFEYESDVVVMEAVKKISLYLGLIKVDGEWIINEGPGTTVESRLEAQKLLDDYKSGK